MVGCLRKHWILLTVPVAFSWSREEDMIAVVCGYLNVLMCEELLVCRNAESSVI